LRSAKFEQTLRSQVQTFAIVFGTQSDALIDSSEIALTCWRIQVGYRPLALQQHEKLILVAPGFVWVGMEELP
jgi:hypothetical protein